MTQAGVNPPAPTPATPPATEPTPATPPAAAATPPAAVTPPATPHPTADLTQDLTFTELAAALPPGVLIVSGAGLAIDISALTSAAVPGDYGVSQFLYALIAAAEKAQATVNAGRLASKKIVAVQTNFAELRQGSVRFSVTLTGYADLAQNLRNIRAGA